MSEIETGGPAFPSGVAGTEYGKHAGCAMENGMTMRQYAAIKLRVPNSGVDWLDEMIADALRNDFAAKAMQGFAADPNCTFPDGLIGVSTTAYAWADAMLAARSKP